MKNINKIKFTIQCAILLAAAIFQAQAESIPQRFTASVLKDRKNTNSLLNWLRRARKEEIRNTIKENPIDKEISVMILDKKEDIPSFIDLDEIDDFAGREFVFEDSSMWPNGSENAWVGSFSNIDLLRNEKNLVRPIKVERNFKLLVGTKEDLEDAKKYLDEIKD